MYLFNKIPSHSKLVIALSGGPDSVYLLYQLNSLKKDKEIKLNLAHLNHNTRGRESDADEKFVTQLADKFKLPLTIKKLTIPKNTKSAATPKYSEVYLREERYKFLEDVRKKTKSDYIVTAHTFDDQIETIIFNFIRGSGSKGLSGMTFKRGKILRPLLNTKKTDILAYHQKNQIEFRFDSSNLDQNYTRNFIRHSLIPLIKNINPNIYQSLKQLSSNFRNQYHFLQQETKHHLQEITIQTEYPIEKWTSNIKKLLKKSPNLNNKALITLSLIKYQQLHQTLQKSILHYLLNPFVPKNKQLASKHLSEIRNILLHSRGGSQKILFNTLSIRKKSGKILLYKL